MDQTVSHEQNLRKRRNEYDASLREYGEATNNYYRPLPLGGCYHSSDRSTEERRLNRARSVAKINEKSLLEAERAMQMDTFARSMADRLDGDVIRHIFRKM
jgi:hypothetical protein